MLIVALSGSGLGLWVAAPSLWSLAHAERSLSQAASTNALTARSTPGPHRSAEVPPSGSARGVAGRPTSAPTDDDVKAQEPSFDRVEGAGAPGDGDWLPPGPRRCGRRGRRRYCDGPLRAPAPHGEAAARAVELGLGDREAWFRALSVEEPPAAWLAAIPTPENEAALLWPVPEGFLGRRFGQRLHGDPDATPHPGIDIPAAEGADVRAAADGLVVYAGDERHGYGNVAMLMHRDGRVTIYAHLSALYVFAGQLVERGASLGAVGKTGLAHGSHLHFEWRRRGRPRDPRRHLVGRPDHDTERQLANEQRARRREAEAHLAELRARAERNAARRARRAQRTTGPTTP